MYLKWVIVLPLSLAAICPLQKHQVCNVMNDEDHHSAENKHQCTCAVTVLSDKSAPEQSCTNFIKRDGDGSFPVVSLTFNLKESPEMDDFPEDSFRDTVAGALRVNPADILILRVNCQGTEDTLTVQFGVLKKHDTAEAKPISKIRKIEKKMEDDVDEDEDSDDADIAREEKDEEERQKTAESVADDDEDDDDNVDDRKQGKKSKAGDNDESDEDEDEDDDGEEKLIKYDPEMFVDAESVATRMKAMGHLSQIADLQVDTIEFTEDIINLEYDPDNSLLIIQAIAAAVTVILMMMLGIWATCRRQRYSDELQKA